MDDNNQNIQNIKNIKVSFTTNNLDLDYFKSIDNTSLKEVKEIDFDDKWSLAKIAERCNKENDSIILCRYKVDVKNRFEDVDGKPKEEAVVFFYFLNDIIKGTAEKEELFATTGKYVVRDIKKLIEGNVDTTKKIFRICRGTTKQAAYFLNEVTPKR